MENKINKNIALLSGLKNADGKRLLVKTTLEYSKEISLKLHENPNLLELILSELEMTTSDFLEYLTGFKIANITFYDETLSIINSNTTRRSR